MSNSGTKTGLFLIELVVALLLFAFCAAICMQLFVAARGRTNDSDNLSQSVYLVTSAAECYKASGGSLEAVQELLGGIFLGDDALIVRYNENWKVASVAESWAFALVIQRANDGVAEVKVIELGKTDTDKDMIRVSLDETKNVIYTITVKAVSSVA